MQIRERSRRARRTGSDGEDSCDHVQNTPRGVVSSARHQDEEQREILKRVLDEKAVGVEVIRVERTRSDISSLTQQSAQSDSSLTTASAAREKETQDSSKSEAKHLNDTLQRASLTRAELMDDVDTIQRVISVLEGGEQKSSPNAKGDRHEHRGQRHTAHNRSHRCSSGHKCQRTEVGELRERPSIKR